MTNNELKAIAGYMPEWQYNDSWGLFKKVIRPIDKVNPIILDSNSAWECVQEMERKGDWDSFSWEIYKEGGLYGGDVVLWSNKEVRKDFIPWLYNPANFFSCFGKWCLERSENETSKSV